MTRPVTSLVALALFAAACSSVDEPGTLKRPASVAASAQPVARGGPSYDDELLALEDRIPGFAGVFVDSSGGLVVNVTNGRQIPPGLAGIIGDFVNGHPAGIMGPHVARPGFSIHEVRYDFRALTSMGANVKRSVWAHGMNSLDLNEAEDVLVVGVPDAARMPTVQAALQAAGIPGDAFRIEVGTLREIAQSSLADRTPVAGGVQITNPLPGTGHVSSCSFGISFQLRDWNTFAFTPDYYGIMPDHCSGIRGSVDTLPWSQSNAQNRFIGREVFTPAPYTGGDCPGTDTCIVDLTVLKITDSAVTQSMNAQRGLIAWPNLGDSTFTFSSYMNDVGPSSGNTSGQHIGSVGVSSGRREQDGLRSTCVTVKADGSPYTFTCENEAYFRSYPGDSGGPVYETTSTSQQIRLMGIVNVSHDWQWWNLTGWHFDHTTYFVTGSAIWTQLGNHWYGYDAVSEVDNTNQACVPVGAPSVNVSC